MPRFRGCQPSWYLLKTLYKYLCKPWPKQAWIPVVSWSLYFWKSVFSFRADSILKSDGDFISNWKFPDCVYFFAAWARQAVNPLIQIAFVYEHTKRTQEMCSPILGTIIQIIFCAQSGAGICLNFWKWSGDSRYPGALSPVLENFRPAFSPEGTTRCGIACVVVGFHMTSLKFKLKNYRSYPEFTFTVH